MAPYKRRFYRNYPYRKWRRRRFYPRRRRFRTTFRYRRKRRVRRNFYKKFFKKKLKYIRLKEWQPNTIKKCKIKGFLTLFAGARGRQNNNFTPYKESFTPEREPGGGGWSIQTLSLGILYQINSDLQNYWTKSNMRLNLCRYLGCSVTCYRQPHVDYIFHWFHDPPNNVTKYYYASFHPIKMLQLKNKVIVPSFDTQPQRRKNYKKFFIPPPKPFKNQWFFQQHLSNFNLLYIASTAISLTNMTQSNNTESYNISIITLNTEFFRHPNFQYTAQQGFSADFHNYLYSIRNPSYTPKSDKVQDLIFLGQVMLNEAGFPQGKQTPTTKNAWGNIFYHEYLTGETADLYLSSKTPSELFIDTYLTQPIDEILKQAFFAKKTTPNIDTLRYNPYKDKGKGNKVYFVPTYAATQNNWEPTTDPDLMLQDFPLWIMLWGIEEVMKKMGKLPKIDYDWVLVINCSYFDIKKPYIVPITDYFSEGQGPYGTDRQEVKGNDFSHWYPCFRYQREVVNAICMTGPAVFRADNQMAFEALIKYTFYFKWGGNPSPMESVFDPNSQPITPYPSGQLIQNEIINPETDIQTFIYPWDCRRDFLTQSATTRITNSSQFEKSLFTDTTKTTDVPLFQTPQKKKTPEEEEEALLLQLNQLQQHNQQLRNRLLRMKLQLLDQ